MTRSDLQSLARLRLRDARALLRAGQHQGAYYMSGYAVECALKACIARQVRRYEFPNKKVALESYVHDLNQLLRVAGLGPPHQEHSRLNPQFAVNWAIVKDWKEDARYDLNITSVLAVEMYAAITGRTNGIMRWLRNHW